MTQAGSGMAGNLDAPPGYRVLMVEGEAARKSDRLAAACERIFPGFDLPYLTDRLATIADPALACAMRGDTILAFKLGYRRGASLFYSWLGGVDPAVRRSGLAHRLMEVQHLWARAKGYKTIETRTRASNSPMIILNLRHGFVISGYESNADGIAIVTQRKALP